MILQGRPLVAPHYFGYNQPYAKIDPLPFKLHLFGLT